MKEMLPATFDIGISIPLRNGQGTGLGRQQDLSGSHGDKDKLEPGLLQLHAPT